MTTRVRGCEGLRWIVLLVLLVVAVGLVRADVRLPGLFSDHMVLQRGKPIWVWGWATPGEQVTVTLGRARVSVAAERGEWRVRLPAQKAGGPFTLVVEGRNRIEVQDVLVGEVWICSGQSNMEWPMRRSHQPEEDIKDSRNPWIRLYTVPKLKSPDPVDDVKAVWRLCQPEAVADFSAVAYYFGRDLQEALRVPVGLVHTSWGGSPAEAWMRWEVMAANEGYRRDILDPWPEQDRRFREELAKWERETEELKQQGKQQTRGRPWANWRPAELYNGMIAPLLPYSVAGAIWYQGESNAGRAHQYRHLFPNMIQNWRDDWNQGPFPFLAVQLAPWDKNKQRPPEEIAAAPVDSDWAELREAQLMASQAMRNVGLAVITDVGDKDDIHPARKGPVGARLALLARRIAYGQKVVSNGPVFKSMKVKKGNAILSFDHVGGGLEARGGRLRGFAICGDDGRFLWANAEIVGSTVVVNHPLISRPVAVRYGWADYPIVNLFNREGLPASPFRTDAFPMVTAPKE
jgi:sialate O-acetylesterase